MNYQQPKTTFQFDKYLAAIPSMRVAYSSGITYRCICSKMFGKHKNRLSRHLQKCQDAKKHYEERRISTQFDIEQIQSQPARKDIDNSKAKWDQEVINDLQRQINQINSRFYEMQPHEMRSLKMNELARTYAELFWKQTSSLFQNHIEAGFQSLFKDILERRDVPSHYFLPMRLRLSAFLNSLNFSILIDDYSTELEKAHKILIDNKQKCLKGDRSIEAYFRGYQFWKNFENLRDYGQIISKISSLKPRAKEEVCRYYKQVTKLTSYPFPHIPVKFFTHRELINSQKRKKITIENVRSLVGSLLGRGLPTLAVDFWFCVCLGLRKREMLRVRLQNDQGQFYDALNLFEQKNNHFCIRPVPQSLKRLVKKYKTVYPFTMKRIEAMQQISSKLNRRFYGYRSACITQLISAFSATTFRTHHSTSITNRYYLNKQSFAFIDSFFKLELVEDESFIPLSGLYLQESENLDFIELAINQDELAITLKQLIEDLNFQEQEKQQLMVSGVEVLIQNASTQPEQVQELHLISRLYKDFKVEIQSTDYSSILMSLKSCLLDRHLQLVFSNYFGSKTIDQSNVTEFLEVVYEISCVWITIQNGKIIQYPCSMDQNKERCVVCIQNRKEGETWWKISDHEIKYSKNQHRSQLMTRNTIQSQQQWNFIKKMPTCIYCSKSLTYQECNQHLSFACPNHTLHHKCFNVDQSLQTRTMAFYLQSTSSVYIHSKFQQISFQRQRNNIGDVIDKTFRTFIHNYQYYSTLPYKKIRTNISMVDQQTKIKVMENRKRQQYLPVKIVDVLGKGYGVLATKDLQSGVLLCSYLGILGTNENLMNGDDSQFNCGFVASKKTVQEIIIIARQCANLGRFLNAPDDQSQANCRAQFLLLPEERDLCSLAVVYITKKNIKANQELTVKYSDLFWKFEASGQQKLTSESTFTPSINNLYAEFPVEFKMFMLKKALISHVGVSFYESSQPPKAPQLLLTKNERQQDNQELRQLSNLAPSTAQIQIRLLFKPTDLSLENDLIGNFCHSSILREKYQNFASISQFQMIYPRIINVKGDGECLFRSIAFSFMVEYYKEAVEFFFSKLEPLDFFSVQMNKNLRVVESFLKKWIEKEYTKGSGSWCDALKKIWNNSYGLDKFCCEVLRKRCIRQFQQNFNRYSGFWSHQQIQEVNYYLKKPKHNARDPVPYAISQILNIQINIWILFQNDTQTHLIGDHFKNRLDIALINEHYFVALRQESIQKKYSFFQTNADPRDLLERPSLSQMCKKSKRKVKSQLLIETGYLKMEQVPTIYLTKSEWENLEEFVLESQIKYRQFGALRIVPPFKMANIHKLLHGLKRKRINRYLQSIVRINQYICFYQNYESDKSHIFDQFWKEGCQQDKNVLLQNINLDQIDEEFWSNFTEGKIGEYSPDNPISACDMAEMKWNTQQFKTFFNEIVKQTLVGINKPYTFIAKKNSVFGWHQQDYQLGALNYQLAGLPKIWYIISADNADKFQLFCQQNIDGVMGRKKYCDRPLNHKNFIINPYQISKKGIKVRKLVQRQNDLVIVFPKAFHSGYNYGHNINEAINYGTINWLSALSSFVNCRCGVIPKLDIESLLKNLGQQPQQVLSNPAVRQFLSKHSNIKRKQKRNA